jgi:hypothetical protein
MYSKIQITGEHAFTRRHPTRTISGSCARSQHVGVLTCDSCKAKFAIGSNRIVAFG